MSTRTVRVGTAVAALSLLTGLGGVAAGTAQASRSPVITVQDQGGADGAGVDSDGTQGDYRDATVGTVTGPIMNAVPQFTAG